MIKDREKISRISLIITILYICLVIYFVLFADRLGRTEGFTEYRYNFQPLEEIRRFIIYRDNVAPGALILNLLGNLIVFIPLGFLIPIWRRGKANIWRVTVSAFLFSLLLETLQLVTRVGVFDVDDLLLNTIGGLLGYILYRIVLYFYRHRPGQKEEP